MAAMRDGARPSAAELERSFQNAVELHQSGRHAEAEPLYMHVLRFNPQHADALNMMGVLAAQQGEMRRGRELLKAAIAERPDQPGYHFNLAHILHMAGESGAARAYRRTLELDPIHIPALVNLGMLLLSRDQAGDAADCFEAALRSDSRVPGAWEGLGMARQGQNQTAEAIKAFERALALEPENAAARANLGSLLFKAGRMEAAATQIKRAIDTSPGEADLHTNLGLALAGAGELSAAIAAFDAALQIDPGFTRAIGAKGMALAELGDQEAAARIYDFDRFLVSTSLAQVPGYDRLEAFNAALAEAILEHPTFSHDRPSKITRIGAQTGELLGGPTESLAVLEQILREAVQTYFQFVSDRRDFPVPVPEQWRLSARGTVLRTGGFQDPHNHPAGILSGVYYVKIPAGGDSGAGPHQGAIEFGRPPASLGLSTIPGLRLIDPEAGQLIMFPSYFWHRTIPFYGREQRISIAFDVIAEA